MIGPTGAARRAAFLFAAALAAATALAGPAQARARALLIGVSTYDDPAIRSLEGPRNDVALMRRHLLARGHAAADVVTLSEEPDAAAPPTRAAILAALDALAEASATGDAVTLHYSGHGSTQPEGAVEEGAEPEPGGRVQVLLPKDAGRYDAAQATIRNAIRDKELGAALDRIRARGARLFVTIDACHAGTATRAGAGVARGVSPDALGAPEAVAPAAAAAPARRATLKLDPRGALVGFFAVDAWSEALERPFPAPGEEGKRVYGAFTWHLVRALEQGRARSFRELARLVALDMARASASLPAPMFEGDLDAPLPGAAQAGPPRHAARIEGATAMVEAGVLHGVEPGARLALHDGLAADARRVGAAVVGEAGPASSEARVEGVLSGPVWASVESPGAAFRLRAAAQGEAAAPVAAAAQGLPVDLVEGAADIQVVAARGRLWLARDGAAPVTDPGAVERSPSVAADDAAGLRALLWRFARAQTLERLAAAAGAAPGADAARVTLTIQRETDPGRLADPRRACAPPQHSADRAVEPDMAEALGHCDAIRLAVENVGERDLDVGVFFIDPAADIATPSSDWRRNGCVAFLPAKAGRPLVVRTQAQLWAKGEPGLAGPHRVLVFATPRQAGMPANLCHVLEPAPPPPQALRSGARGFAALLARAGFADPGLRAANPFATEDAEADAGVTVRRYVLDLRAASR